MDPHRQEENSKRPGFITSYAMKAAERSVDRRGPFPRHHDREDMVQETHRLLCKQLGADYERLITTARQENWESSLAHEALKKAVRKAIEALRGTADKRRQRRLPQEVNDEEAIKQAPEPELMISEAAELAIDVTDVVARFSEEDREIVRLLMGYRKGKEIAERLQIDARRVSEAKKRIIDVLKGALNAYAPIR